MRKTYPETPFFDNIDIEMITIESPIKLAHAIWQGLLYPEDFAIDATCGNGHDALFLTSLLPKGELYCIDVQKEAIEATRQRIGEENVKFFLGSHERFPKMERSPKLIVYNLGYLPGSDKSITTEVNTTLVSVEEACEIITPGGIISITCYPGHEEGAREQEALLDFVKKLSSKEFQVSHHQFINKNKCPSLIIINKNMLL